MKKTVALFAVLAVLIFTAACNKKEKVNENNDLSPEKNISVALICSGDGQDFEASEHTLALKDALLELGITQSSAEYVYGVEDFRAQARTLSEKGVDIIFTPDEMYEDELIKVAQEFPDTSICVSQGLAMARSGLDNAHNYNGMIYKSKFLSGVASAAKIVEEIRTEKIPQGGNVKLGYVSALEGATARSGYTAFFLGVKYGMENSLSDGEEQLNLPGVTLDVVYTSNRERPVSVQDAVNKLSDGGCVVIGTDIDSDGVAKACEEKGIFCVGEGKSRKNVAPNTFMPSAVFDWKSYDSYAIGCELKGKEIEPEWHGDYSEIAGRITTINEDVSLTAQRAVKNAEERLAQGDASVFNVNSWTNRGRMISSTADMDAYDMTEYIMDGTFAEGLYGNEPKFNFVVDGVTEF